MSDSTIARSIAWNRDASAAGPGAGRGGEGHHRRDRRQGLHRRQHRQGGELGAHRQPVADDVRPGLLRGGDDPRLYAALRSRPVRHHSARLAAAERRDDRRRHADQQNGAGAAQGLRPDAGAALGDQHGKLRQRRRLLPLFAIRWCAAATASCRWTSMCPAARRPPRRWSTASCSCRRRSAAPGRSSVADASPKPSATLRWRVGLPAFASRQGESSSRTPIATRCRR